MRTIEHTITCNDFVGTPRENSPRLCMGETAEYNVRFDGGPDMTDIEPTSYRFCLAADWLAGTPVCYSTDYVEVTITPPPIGATGGPTLTGAVITLHGTYTEEMQAALDGANERTFWAELMLLDNGGPLQPLAVIQWPVVIRNRIYSASAPTPSGNPLTPEQIHAALQNVGTLNELITALRNV